MKIPPVLLFIFAASTALAQTSNVQKSTPTNRLSAGFKVPSGQTIQFESGSTLQVDTGAITSIMVDPMTTAGDTIFRNASNLTDRRAIGTSGQIYTVVSGVPAWATPSFAPVGATYITETADGTLTNEFALGSLATGLLKNTTSTGVPTIAAAGAGGDYVAPGAATSSGLTMATARLLGRSTASTGGIEEITVGSGLTLSGGALTATGSGSIGGSTGSTDNALIRADGTGGGTVQSSNVTLADSGTAFVFSGAGGITAGGSSTAVTLTAAGSGVVIPGNPQAGSVPSLKLTDSNSAEPVWLRVEQTNVASSFELGIAAVNTAFVTDAVAGDGIFKGYGTGATGLAFGGGGTTDKPSTLYLKWASSGAGHVIVAGHSDDGSNSLQVNGTLGLHSYGAGTLTTDASGNVTATSDERLKILKGSFNRGLKEILDLWPINYSWRAESGNETTGVYSGFSAQNVQSAIPEAVGVQPDGFLTLQDRPIIAALVNAVQTLNANLIAERQDRQALEARLNRLQKEIQKAKQTASR